MLLLATGAALAQEGIISATYIAERTALQKMQAARKAGNEDEVKRLSTEIKEIVDQKKSWARDLLTLTESSIERAQSENAPGLTEDQRAALTAKLERLNADQRILELELEENKWAYFTENHKRHNYIKDWEGQLQAIYDYAAEVITRNQEQISKAEEGLKKLIEAHEKEIEALNEGIQERIKLHEEAVKKEAAGRGNPGDVKSCEQAIESSRENVANIRQKINEGTYTSRADNWTNTNSYRATIKNCQDEIARINVALADETMTHRYAGTYGTPSISACKKVIEETRGEIEKQRALYTAEEWGNRKDLRQRREYLHVEILKLQEEVGLKDDKIAALIARRDELEQFVYHDFLTELPKEDSGFIKAIKWISKTLDRVSEVTEKFEKFKKVVDLVKGSTNPYNAVNYVFQEATGKSLTARLAEKLLPDKVLENPLVQRMIKGESVSRQDILKEAIVENLPPDVKRKVEQTVDLLNSARSGNIRDLVAQKGFEQAMRVIDSQPELKKAFEAFDQANKIIHNPALLQDRLENTIRERVTLELKAAGREAVDSLVSEETRKRVEAYQDRIKKIEQDIGKNAGLVADAVTESALISVQKGVECRVGLNDSNLTAVEDLIVNYPLPKDM